MFFLLVRFLVRLAQAAAVLAAVLVLVFFGLTRTEVGRDGLRGQIERAFGQQFEGSLEIGKLTGNLVYALYATDLRLRDDQGRVVIAADSIALQPTWLGLLQRRLVLEEATLFRPRIDLVRSASGRWNIADAFAPRAVRTGPSRPLDIRTPDVVLVDAALTTRREGEAPAAVQRGTLFDYTDATVRDLTLSAEFDWTERARRLRLHSLAAQLPEQQLDVRRLEGILDLTGGDLALSGVMLETTASRIEGSFGLMKGEDTPPRIELDLAPSQVSGAELARFVPALPLADAVDVSARASGPLDDLTVQKITLARGETALRAEGTVRGLPETVTFDAALASSTLRQGDVEAVWPSLALPDLRGLGTARVRLGASGSVRDGRFDVRSTFAATTDAGRADGTLRLGQGAGGPLTYALDTDAANVNPGVLLGDAFDGDLSGRIALDGRGTRAETFAADLRLALSASRFAGRTLDTLAADLSADGLRFSGTADLALGGALRLGGTADFSGEVPAFDLDLSTRDLDLSRLAGSAPATRLTADATLTGQGSTPDDFSGDLLVAFAPSTLTLTGEPRPIAAHEAALRVRPAGSPVRFDLDSDLAAVRVGGGVDVGAVVALATQWGEAVARTVQAEQDKYLRPSADSLHHAAVPVPDPVAAAAQDLALELEVRRPDALQDLLPGFPAFAPGTALDVQSTLAPESLALTATVRGDSVRVPGLVGRDFAGALSLRSTYGETLLGRSTLDLDLEAGTLLVAIGPLTDAAASVRLDGSTGSLQAQSARFREGGHLALDAGLDLRPEVNRVTLRRVEVVTDGQQWANVGTGTVDLYTDAIRLSGLAFERVQRAGTPPRLALGGTLSTLDADSLYVDATALDLGEISSVLGPRLRFGGRLDAELAVARVLRRPAVIGRTTVERFSFAGRRVGYVDLESRYAPGTDGVAVDLRLRPEPAPAQAGGDPASLLNDLSATGTVRFPGTAADGTRDPGALDLALDIDRLDLFIFDWLFPTIVADASGYAAGPGRITGTPRVPYFDADLQVREGAFRIPDFGLRLAAEGRLTVDREGFHIRSAQISDKSGGQGLVRGDILFNDYRFFSLDLAADLAEMEIIDVPQSDDLPFYGYIRATGSATVTGPIDNVFLRSTDAQTTPDSEMFIPVTASGPAADAGFLVFADSLGNVPEFEARRSVLSRRPEGERAFLDGLEMNLGVVAPPGSTVHLVFDPAIGDVITAVGSARLQLAIREGEFQTFGTFDVARGDYLFTAGDVFTRRFGLAEGGTLRWDGDPIDARLDLPATYRTRASLAGLDLPDVDTNQRVPLIITLGVTGRVTSPLVDLSIALDESNRTTAGAEGLRRQLNESDRQAEYATSVLLTNSFLLAPTESTESIAGAADELFFTSLSQLVSSRLSQFINDALGADNLDVRFGVQQGVRDGSDADDLDFDLTYGVALRLLDERLVIRGEGIYQRLSDQRDTGAFQGEVAVAVRLTPSVSLEVFYRREEDVLLGSGLDVASYGAYGAGISYSTDFANWNALLRRVIGRSAGRKDAATRATTLWPEAP
ncbi:MAG: translocation/assembly module TamB domain-containing protein [Bacteroidota bacterium]